MGAQWLASRCYSKAQTQTPLRSSGSTGTCWRARRHSFVGGRAAGFGAAGATLKKAPKSEQPPVWEVYRSQCPCASGRKYEECCRPYLRGNEAAPTPEAVMRARFTAYVKNAPQYIADSTHPENPAARGTFNADGTLSSTLLEDAAATCRRFAYRRLAIVRAPLPEPDAADAWVTFQAWFRLTNQIGQLGKKPAQEQRLDERSHFRRDAATGRWLYLSGEVSLDGEPKEDSRMPG